MVTEPQQAEIDKYKLCYQLSTYAMGDGRRRQAELALAELPHRGFYLDVGCGRGEMLDFAEAVGFTDPVGVEVVEALLDDRVERAPAWDLPYGDGDIEVVTLFDVIEHLLPGDDERVCRELARVASRSILITANNRPSVYQGMDLHVNRRPYDVWDGLFRAWFTAAAPGAVVTWLHHRAGGNSEMWRVDLPAAGVGA